MKNTLSGSRQLSQKNDSGIAMRSVDFFDKVCCSKMLHAVVPERGIPPMNTGVFTLSSGAIPQSADILDKNDKELSDEFSDIRPVGIMQAERH